MQAPQNDIILKKNESSVVLINPTINDFMQCVRANYASIVDRKLKYADIYFTGDHPLTPEYITIIHTLVEKFDVHPKKYAVGYLMLRKFFPS